MKRTIALLLSVVITVAVFQPMHYVFATDENNETEEFVDEMIELVDKYDSFSDCRLIVEQNSGFNPLNSVDTVSGFEDFHIVQFKSVSDTEAAFEYYSNCKNVVSVEMDETIELDEFSAQDTSIDDAEIMNYNDSLMHISEAKQHCADKTTEVVVGVIDSGVMKEHEAIESRFLGGKSFVDFDEDTDKDGGYDPYGHGTGVAGVIASSTSDNVKIRSYSVLTKSSSSAKPSTSASVLSAAILQSAEDGCNIINCSIGGENQGSDATIISSAVEYASGENVRVVVSAGNENANLTSGTYYPASLNKAITVGSCEYNSANNTFLKAGYSNYGKYLDVYALGDVYTANNDGGYQRINGTSFSSPYTAAACAMRYMIYPDESLDAIKQCVIDSATSVCSYDDMPIIDFYGMLTVGEVTPKYCQAPEICITDNGSEKLITLSCSDPTAMIYYTIVRSSYQPIFNEKTDTKNVYTAPVPYSNNFNIYVSAKSSTTLESEKAFSYGRFGHSKNGFYCNDNGVITCFVSDEYSGDIENIVVPELIDGVAPIAFNNTLGNTSQYFPENVISVRLPDSLETIGKKTFLSLKKLKTVYGAGVKRIDEHAFASCTSLETCAFNQLKEVGTYAFTNCTNLNDGSILQNVERIGDHAFARTGFTTITSKTMVEIGDNSFYGCSQLIEVELPNLENAGTGAFYECGNLTDVNLGKIQKLNSNIFASCSSLERLLIPEVTEISYDAFGDYLGESGVEVDYIYAPKIAGALGASIRLSDSGLRFGFTWDDTTDIEDTVGENMEYGFVYAYEETYDLTIKNGRKKVATNRIIHDNEYTSFNLVFTKIPKANYDTNISARAYVCIDGLYFYSDIITRSFEGVANAVLADDTIDAATKEQVRVILEA